jgi:hypothetical protein
MEKVVKLMGQFVWHHHGHELVLVVMGRLLMKLRDRTERTVDRLARI